MGSKSLTRHYRHAYTGGNSIHCSFRTSTSFSLDKKDATCSYAIEVENQVRQMEVEDSGHLALVQRPGEDTGGGTSGDISSLLQITQR
jgi:hypothetical protein